MNSGDAIRRIFRKAFNGAGLDYYHPHSPRKTLTRLGEQVCKTPEDFKAWSQNIGHESVMTTFGSYGEVAPQRQAEIICGLGDGRVDRDPTADEIATFSGTLVGSGAIVTTDPIV